MHRHERPPHERLLIVDDDPAVVEYLVEMLGDEGYRVEGVTSGAEALERLAADSYDVVIADVEMPELRGIDLLPRILDLRPDQLVLLITAYGSIELAVEAVRAGAADFVTKPFKLEVLLVAIDRALKERRMRREIIRLRRRLSTEKSPTGLVAKSEAMSAALATARRAARTDVSVLLTGESGVGKGALARFIHDHGARRERAFVQVNCAALPEPLIESEFFGVRRGAFTDAREHRDGLFVNANGGTLFLDEVGEMPLDVQAKLLLALESGRIRPVGGTSELGVDVRVIAATNRPLEDALRERRFRPDLYFRLNVVRIDLPPLRARREDIPDLVDTFLQRACDRFDRAVVGVSEGAMRWLLGYHWPGNVRELANLIDRAVALAEHDTLVAEDLIFDQPEAPSRLADDDPSHVFTRAAERGTPLADIELAYLRAAVEANGGNMAQAARRLGIDRRTLYRKLGKQPR